MIDSLDIKISPLGSLLISISLTITFVGGIYLFSSKRHRDDPIELKSRIKRVYIASLISYLVLYSFTPSLQSFIQIIGLWTPTVTIGILYPLLLTAILFFGPLVMSYYDGELLNITYKDIDLYWIRNYVVGPSAEEMVFRSVICPILYFGGYSTSSIILYSPLLFGLAHTHHIYPLRKTREEIINQVAAIVVQVIYTSLFGMFSALIFLHTGSLLSCIISHSFCNMNGFPNVQDIPDHPKRNIISICFVLGLVGFIYLFPVLTNPAHFNSIYYRIN